MIYYLLFALATGFYSLFMHFIPAVKDAEAAGVEDEIIESKLIAYTTYFCIAFVAAPLVFLTVVSTNSAERFKKGMREALEKNES